MTPRPQTASDNRPGGRRRRGLGKGFAVLVITLGLAVAAAPMLGLVEPERIFDAQELWRRLVVPLFRALAFIAFGLFVGQMIETLGWHAKLGLLARPLMRMSHLPPQAGTAFTAAFASGVAANTLLYTSWREGGLDDRQLILANLMNASLPAFLLHLPSTFFVVYALLGQTALVYFGLTLAAAAARFVVLVVVSRLILPDKSGGPIAAGGGEGTGKTMTAVWARFLSRLKTLILIIFPVYVGVFLLVEGGFFKWLTGRLADFVGGSLVSLEAMGVVVFSVMAEFTAGFSAAAAFLDAGGLTAKQVVLALIIGNLAATPVRVLRHQLPHYMAIYTPGLGIKLLTIGQAVRIASVAAAAGVYYWLG